MRRVLALLLLCLSATGASALLFRGGVGVVVSPPAGLTNMVAIETTGGTQTNVPFTIGVPFASGTITTSQKIQAVDGISGNPLTCDETNRYSDLGNAGNSYTPTVRGTTLTCIIPSLTANTTDTIALSVVSGAPSTSGTDLTTANITSTSYDNSISIVNKHGTTETASPLTALSSGNTSWVNVTTAAVLGKWRSGSGLVTSYISYVPFKNGATADPEGLYALFDTTCVKGSTAAYNASTNPILKCTTDVIISAGVAQAASSDTWLGMTMPSNNCTPGLSASKWARTAPTQTLTLSSNTIGFVAGVTANSALFTSDSPGTMITDGTGWGSINHYIDSTHASIDIWEPFAGTSLTSGNYNFYPIALPFGSRIVIRCSYAPSGTPSNIDVENGNLYLGDAWNNGALTGGPGTYMISSRLLRNYYTATNPGLASLTNFPMSAYEAGSNPSGYSTVGSLIGGQRCPDPFAGAWKMVQQGSGDYEGRGPAPQLYVQALIKYDSSAAAYIFPAAARFMTIPSNTISNTTGTVPDTTSAIFTYKGYGGGTNIAAPAIGCWGDYPNSAHGLDPYFIPYIMTGDWKWMVGETNLAMSLTAGNNNPSVVGIGLDAVPWGYGTDERSNFWPVLGLARLVLIRPDSDTTASPSTVLGWFNKDKLHTFLENAYTEVGSNSYLSAPYPGTIISLGTGACPGGATCSTRYIADNYRQFSTGGFGFQSSFGVMLGGSMYEEGTLSANGKDWWSWYSTGPLTAITNTTDLPHGVLVGPAYHWGLAGQGTNYTWATTYKFVDIGPPPTSPGWPDADVGIGLPGRIINGTMSLSAGFGTPGNTITVTVPAGGYFSTTGGFYDGAYVVTYDGGFCTITTVTNSTSFGCLVGSVGFGSSSYSNSAWATAMNSGTTQWGVPYAKGGDTNGLEVAGLIAYYTAGNGLDYLMMAQTNMCGLVAPYLAAELPAAAGACTSLLSYSGGAPIYSRSPIAFNYAAR